MQKLFLVVLIFLPLTIFSQVGDLIFTDTINFENIQNELILKIDTNNTTNLWQVGSPDKNLFDTAFSVPNAIITDTVNPYSINNKSYFDIIIKNNNPWMWWPWGEGLLSFRHKYNTDSLFDGGHLEISYDLGNTFFNLIYDTNQMMGTSSIGFYNLSDTILGNIPSFTGTSNGWTYSEYYWWWFALVDDDSPHDSLIIRFVFNSDNNNSNKEGWMIDNIIFNGYDYVGNINKIEYSNEIIIYPNPSDGKFFINFKTIKNTDVEIKIINITGQCVFNKIIKTNTNAQIDLGKQPKGIYLIKAGYNNCFKTKKIIIE